MLPLFKEDSHSVSLMCHAMNLIKKITAFVNPGQIPVIALDQPLFCIAKNIQWSFPESYGENKLIVMMGGFHIESAFMTAIGSWLRGSGWVEALVEAGITTIGKACQKKP